MTTTEQLQKQFVSHIRDPENISPVSGIEDRRLQIYRDLFFNNINGFVSSAFPVLRSLYDQQNWHKLVREFFVNHSCHSPIFLEIAQEFLSYLSDEYQVNEQDPAFLLELAHYEWVELEISIRKESSEQKRLLLDGAEALTEQALVVSELAWPLSYQYDVQHISSEYQPVSPPEQPTYIVVYRNDEDEVEFTAINAASMQILAVLSESPGLRLPELINKIVQLMPNWPEQAVSQGVIDMLSGFATRGIVKTA